MCTTVASTAFYSAFSFCLNLHKLQQVFKNVRQHAKALELATGKVTIFQAEIYTNKKQWWLANGLNAS